MHLTRLFAQLKCVGLDRSIDWYTRLFDRAPDAEPMAGLAEWHEGRAGFQLFKEPQNAGRGTMTLIVTDLAGAHARLEMAGLAPGEIEAATSVDLIRLRDPDGNLVVLAEPRETCT